MEVYKDIPGYEGLYQVSNYGNVRSLNRKTIGVNGRTYFKEGRTLKLGRNQGYRQVRLYRDGKSHVRQVHRLVALAFLPNPSKYPQINHKDGVKDNNNLDNLEWCTVSQNTQHAVDNNLIKILRGSANGSAKLTEEDVLSIRRMYNTGEYSQKELVERFDVSITTMSRIIHNKRWSHLPSCEELKSN